MSGGSQWLRWSTGEAWQAARHRWHRCVVRERNIFPISSLEYQRALRHLIRAGAPVSVSLTCGRVFGRSTGGSWPSCFAPPGSRDPAPRSPIVQRHALTASSRSPAATAGILGYTGRTKIKLLEKADV